MTEPSILLRVSDVGKAYPGVQALSHVSLDLRRGEVHALVGENGAGKSTLARVVCGFEPPEGGAMWLNGSPYAPAGKIAAERLGVRMVMQELALIPTLSVAENIFFHRLPSTLGVIRRRRLYEDARQAMAGVGLKGIEPDALVGELGVGQQQMVEIAAGLSQRCDILFLDEPSAALTRSEIEILFEQIERLKRNGVCVVYISHRMEEIQRISDRITVLRDGRVRGTLQTSEAGMDEIVRLMVGRDLGAVHPKAAHTAGPCALRVEGLSRAHKVRNVSFQLRRGEILGFAGLMGSGRTELVRMLFGADLPDSGAIYLHESARREKIRSPRDAVRRGMALLTEDRKTQGLLLPLPIRANTSLARMGKVSRFGWIAPSRERQVAARYVDRLSIRCRSVEQETRTLSGGNQQKVVLAKWLHREPEILIFDEPTRGIDVGAKFEIYRLLMELAEAGKAILVVSSDMPELFAISDRIAVMSNGALSGIFKRGEWSQEGIMAAALSEYRSGGESGASP